MKYTATHLIEVSVLFNKYWKQTNNTFITSVKILKTKWTLWPFVMKYTATHLIEVSVLSQESKQTCIYV